MNPFGETVGVLTVRRWLKIGVHFVVCASRLGRGLAAVSSGRDGDEPAGVNAFAVIRGMHPRVARGASKLAGA